MPSKGTSIPVANIAEMITLTKLFKKNTEQIRITWIEKQKEGGVRPSPQIRLFEAGKYKKAFEYAAKINSKVDLYFDPNEVVKGIKNNPQKKHILACVCSQVDCDAETNQTDDPEGFQAELAAILKRLTDLGCFSLIIFTGGGYQAFIFFDEPTTRFADVEHVNKIICDLVGGDASCTNINKFMRLAGSVNRAQTKTKIEKGRVPTLSKIVANIANLHPSFDELFERFTNLHEHESKPKPKQEQQHQQQDPDGDGRRDYTKERFDEYTQMLAYIIITSADDYDRWLEVGFAIYELGWGARGYRLWTLFSAKSGAFNEKDQLKEWQIFQRREYRGRKTTIGSVVEWAKEGGWQPSSPLPKDDPDAIGSTTYKPIEVDLDKLFPGDTDWLGEFIQSIANSVGVDTIDVLMLIMPLIAGVYAPHYKVLVPGTKWLEALMIWSLTLALSGYRKSVYAALLLAVFKRWEETEVRNVAKDKITAETIGMKNDIKALSNAYIAIKKKEVEGRYKSGTTLESETDVVSEKSDSPKLKELASRIKMHSLELYAKQQQLAEVDVTHKILQTDITIERSVQFLQETFGRMIHFNTEGTGFTDIVGGRYGNRDSIGEICNLYDGQGFHQARISGDRIAKKASPSYIFQTQPDNARDVLNNKQVKARGLLGRFLLHKARVRPFPIEIAEHQECDSELQDDWDTFITEGLNKESSKREYEVITLSEDAHELFQEHFRLTQESLNELVNEANQTDERDEWALKGCGRTLRFAGILSCVAGEFKTISEEILQAGIYMNDLFQTCYTQAMASVGRHEDVTEAERIVTWLKDKKLEGKIVSRRDIHKAMSGKRSALNKVSTCDPVIAELVDREFLHGMGVPKFGKTGRYFVDYTVAKNLPD